ncbi:MAG: RsmE family RNA methyltransferase, partial [Verrucomicrobiota bacterium]
VSKKNVPLSVLEKTSTPRPPCEITLLQAIPRGKILESIIQKATELGVARMVPLLADRIVSHLDKESAEEKLEKWRQVSMEAIKQCGQPWLPRIETPMTPKDFLSRAENFDLALIGSLQADSRHPAEIFSKIRQEQKTLRRVCVWVGPEGDFSPDEMTAIQAAGAFPITLGDLVLRCETAAIYCLSILNYELGKK